MGGGSSKQNSNKLERQNGQIDPKGSLNQSSQNTKNDQFNNLNKSNQNEININKQGKYQIRSEQQKFQGQEIIKSEQKPLMFKAQSWGWKNQSVIFQYKLKETLNFKSDIIQIVNKYMCGEVNGNIILQAMIKYKQNMNEFKFYKQQFRTHLFLPNWIIEEKIGSEEFYKIYLEKAILFLLEGTHKIKEIMYEYFDEQNKEFEQKNAFVFNLMTYVHKQIKQMEKIEDTNDAELEQNEEYEQQEKQDKFNKKKDQNFIQYGGGTYSKSYGRIYQETQEFIKSLKHKLPYQDILYVQNQLLGKHHQKFQSSYGNSYLVLDQKNKVFYQFQQFANQTEFKQQLAQIQMVPQEFKKIMQEPEFEYNSYSEIIIVKRERIDLLNYVKLRKLQNESKNLKNKPPLSREELLYIIYFMVENQIEMFQKGIIFSDIKLNNFWLRSLKDEYQLYPEFKEENENLDKKKYDEENTYILKIACDQMYYYKEELDQFYPQFYSPFYFKKNIIDKANKQNISKEDMFRAQMFAIGRCIQMCIDPDIEQKYKDYGEQQLQELLEQHKEYLGEQLCEVLKNMEGDNPSRISEWYVNFEILQKDVAYSTHYSGIYPVKNIDDSQNKIIQKFHKNLIKVKGIFDNLSQEEIYEMSLTDPDFLDKIDQDLGFYSQFCLFEQESKILEVSIGYCEQKLKMEGSLDQDIAVETKYILAGYYKRLAQNMQKQGKNDNILQYYKRSIDLKAELLGNSDLELVNSLVQMAKLSYDSYLIDDALDKFKRALHIIQEKYGDKHHLTSSILTKLGKTMQRNKQYDEALIYFYEALDNKSNYFGENHVQLTPELSSIGALYEEIGQYNKALKVFQNQLKILQNHYGQEHPELTKTITNIANVYYLQGKETESLSLMRKCLKITQEFYGEDHVANGRHEFSIGRILHDFEKLYEARDILEKAKIKYERYYGNDNISTIKICQELNEVLREIKEEEQGEF